MKLQTDTKHLVLQYGRVAGYGVLGATLIGFTLLTKQAHADQFDKQIQQIQSQNDQTKSSLSGLQVQASDYQQALSALQLQVDQITQQISTSQNKQADLQQQIDKLEAELTTQRQSLGSVVRAMYVDGQPSVLEELASSKNLSDFVDKQTYRQAVSSNIQSIVAQINTLKSKIVTQKVTVDSLLKDQRAQRDQLASVQDEQSKLLAYNQTQQTVYTAQLVSNQAKIASLRAQQTRLNAQEQAGPISAGNTNHGGYPNSWNNAPMDSVLDPWGLYNRECVSYTAFKVHQDYLAGRNTHDMPYWGGRGNANEWPSNARSSGIPVDGVPSEGAIAVSMAGYYGHTMYVEKVGTMNGRPAIYVSQYNADWNGHYSEGWVYSSGLYFIHFK